MRRTLATSVLAAALFWASAAGAQQVLLNGVPVAGSPNVVNQVAVPDNQTLAVDPGASIVTAADAVIDAVNGTTITVINGGVITSTANDGIDAFGSTLFLTNSGTITGNKGVIASTITNLTNSGTITSNDDEGVLATTITNLTNSGTITGNEEGVRAITITNLTNFGTITGNFDGVEAITITNLTNFGTITGNDDGVDATTITNLTNSGTITGNFIGVLATTITNLTNSGTITGIFSNGVRASTLTNLTNSGTIIGTGGTAIRETGAANTLLTLLPGSNIQGLVDLGGGVNTLNVGNGLNTVTTFTAALPTIITNGAPFATQGTTVAVVDPTFLSLADNLVSDLASSIFSSVTSRLNEAGNGVLGLGAQALDGTGLNVTPVAATPGDARGFWLKGFGGVRKIDGSGPSVDAEHLFGGFVFGVDGESVPGLRLGLFAGLSAGHVDTEFAAQDIDIDSYFAGVYGRHEADGWWLDFAVTGGVLEHDTERLVANNLVPGGIERADGDYDGYFISPEMTVGTRGNFLGHTVKPSFRARYVGAWFEDYTETGTAAPLSVDDREVHTLEGRLQLGFMLTEGPAHGFELRIGVDGRVFLGDENVDATLFAQTLSFDPGGHDESLSGFIGGHFYDQVTESIQIFAGAEFGTGTEVDFRADAQAGVRISF